MVKTIIIIMGIAIKACLEIIDSIQRNAKK